MKKRELLKRCLSVFLSSALLVGMLPAAAAHAAEMAKKPYLTDENGVQREMIGKVASDNHETIDIRMTDGKTHKVTVYLLDEDASGRWSMVDVIDPDTQKLLDSQNVYDFSEGVYLSWNISGHLQIRLTNVWTKRYTKSKDTAIHGIFIDGEDAVANGQAVVTTDAPGEDKAANSFEGVNVLGRYAPAGEAFAQPFDKEVHSVELRFNGNIDPSSENLDKIRVLKDGQAVAGEVRSSFNSATFVPSETMKDGSYTVEIPADVKNSAGQEIGEAARASFDVAVKLEVIYFSDEINLMSRRVELAFNDRLVSTPKASLTYADGDVSREIKLSQSGKHAGRLYAVQGEFFPSGTYHFSLPKGSKSISGAVSAEDYEHDFLFDSTQLSAKISAPLGVEKGDPFPLKVRECFGYGEMRYAFSEEALAQAPYAPVREEISIPTDDLDGRQTLYVQFRVKAGEKAGTESPVLHKAVRFDFLKAGEMLPFDMQSAGAFDKDGFGSVANPTDGVFDLATNTWNTAYMASNGTSNYIADGANGLEGKYDSDKDAVITTDAGIVYHLSKDIYTDGKFNVATGNGKEIPAPSNQTYDKIYVLAAGKYDDNKGTFKINYTDGTSTEQEVNAHYWANESAHAENVVFKGIATCFGWNNNVIKQDGVMRQYELETDASKTLKSVTLPKTSNLIRVFAITGQETGVFGTDESAADLLAHSEGGPGRTAEESDPTYEEFMETYGDDEKLADAADVTDVTNIREIAAGPRAYDDEILAEKDETTSGYGQGLYPYARQPEKLMSYKVRMQAYEDYELDFEDALEVIRRVDNLTRGLDKKCYLVGWQLNGHDSSFPYFGEVNPRHRRPMDETSLDGLKWLMQEAKKYHTTITLHVNLADAYTDDNPLGPSMMEQQIPSRNKDGSIRPTGMWAGHRGFIVSHYANYFTGNFQKNQADPLIAMLPELKGQSVHPDAWSTIDDPYYELSAWDNMDAQHREAKYMREKYNMDLTTEYEYQWGSAEHGSKVESNIDHVLYFPMIWQGAWSETNPMKVPSYIQSMVNAQNVAGRYFGEGTAVEPDLWPGDYGNIEMPGLKRHFAYKELTRQYLNTMLRASLDNNDSTGGEAVLYTGDGQQVISAWTGNSDISNDNYKRTITVKGDAGDDVVLAEPGNVFLPMTWRPGLEIQAWSRDGYTDKTWKLPAEWEGVEFVEIYDLSLEGLRYQNTVEVGEGRTVRMTMKADQTAVVVPDGNNPNSTKGFERNGSVQFLGRDTETGGNWTKNYGGEGYDIFREENNIPETVEINYVNAERRTVTTGYVNVKSVKLDQAQAEMEKGDTLTLKATISPSKATDKTVTWKSSDDKVAAVDENGTVTAVGAGTATITARAGNAEGVCEITVKASPEDEAKAAAAKVEELIKKIGTVTAASKADIEAARAAYNALSDEAKKLVTNVGLLTSAEHKLEEVTKPEPGKTDIAKASVKAIPAQPYSGKALMPAVEISCEGKSLELNKDYTVAYGKNVNIGTASVQITGVGNYTGSTAASFQIIVKKKAVYTVGNYKYRITDAKMNGKGAVALTGIKSKSVGGKLKKITVAGTVKIGGRKFDVTEIGGKAFSGCKKAVSASIGANVTKIGANAFYNCKKLQKITVSSKKLKSVGKNALKNISPKAKIKVPKNKFGAYKKLFRGKGQKKSVKITR